jgi:tetratricopeptide (TPR) repeat protein
MQEPRIPCSTARRGGLTVKLSLILLALVAGIYWPVVGYEFVNLDDTYYVSLNRVVQQGLTLSGIRWAFTTFFAANWHPLTWISHMTDVSLFGLNPAGHHAVNLILHAANAVLLFLVLKNMTGNPLRSAVVAALFAVHPLHVESVAWVSERKDVLATLFWILALGVYRRYVGQGGRSKYVLLVLLFAFGLLAKPMLVTLPFVLLLLDYWPLGRLRIGYRRDKTVASVGGSSLSIWLEKIPLFCLSAVSCVVTILAQSRSGAVVSWEDLPLVIRLRTAIWASIAYLWKAIWPYDLAVSYPHPGHSLSIWVPAAALVLVGIISFLVLRFMGRYPYGAVGWFWYLGTLVPVIGLVQVGPQAMADRYTYMPLTGVFVLVVWAAVDLLKGWRCGVVTLASTGSVVLLAFMVVGGFQVRYWRNSTTLFERSLEISPGQASAHNSLGHALAQSGRRMEAVQHYQEALRLDPRMDKAHYNLANLLVQQGDVREARNHYLAALRINPRYAEAHNKLGVLLADQGQFVEAAAEYAQALRLDNEQAEAHNNLANVLAQRRSFGDAKAHYREALRIDPLYAEAFNNMGNVLTQEGALQEAAANYRRALQLNPALHRTHFNLGILFFQQGNYQEAAGQFREVLRIDPASAEAHNHLGLALAAQRRTAEAIQHYSEALRLKPNYTEASANLARARGLTR